MINVETRAIQLEILKIYKVIKAICDRHGLRFFAVGGTCIGAVRHHGFIPWDDDLDIMMPGKDYDRFKQIAEEELPSNFRLRCPENVPHCTLLFNKVHNIDTTFIEKSDVRYKDCYKGVFVDILPLYGFPENEELRAKHIKRILVLTKLHHATRRSIAECSTFSSKVKRLAVKPLIFLFGKNFWFNEWRKTVKKYEFDTSVFVGDVWQPISTKSVLQKSWFEDYEEIAFEDTTMRVAKGYHEYLTWQFGDYMEMPPEDKRVSNHYVEILDLKKSYRTYYKRGSKII